MADGLLQPVVLACAFAFSPGFDLRVYCRPAHGLLSFCTYYYYLWNSVTFVSH